VQTAVATGERGEAESVRLGRLWTPSAYIHWYSYNLFHTEYGPSTDVGGPSPSMHTPPETGRRTATQPAPPTHRTPACVGARAVDACCLPRCAARAAPTASLRATAPLRPGDRAPDRRSLDFPAIPRQFPAIPGNSRQFPSAPQEACLFPPLRGPQFPPYQQVIVFEPAVETYNNLRAYQDRPRAWQLLRRSDACVGGCRRPRCRKPRA
jgi:hypothetical protein